MYEKMKFTNRKTRICRYSYLLSVVFLLLIPLSGSGEISPSLGIPELGIAQQNKITVTGVVKDQIGPVIGANVVEKGTTNGVVTDLNGNFTLKVPQDAVLVVSFIGYLEQRIPVKNQRTFTILLKEDTQTLEEVVVVGYGVQKKVSVTGAISAVSTKDLKTSSSPRLDNALAGRITGLTSTQTGGGQPGVDDATMFLRGAATMNGQSPLILIDGVERDNIGSIDMNEVESVSVLKDASATSVFGVRGANGVIMITTKRGKEGRPELSISIDQSWTSFTKEPERLHSWDYCNLRNEALKNDGYDPSYSEDVIEKYRNPLAGLDPNAADYETQKVIRQYMYPDNDYYRMYISRYTPQTRANANVSGGTDKVHYFFNAGYVHQGGNLKTESKDYLGYDPSSFMDRWSFRTNLDFKMAKSLTSALNIGTYIEKVNMPAAGPMYGEDTGWMMSDLIYQAQTILPITPGPTTISELGAAPGALIHPTYLDRSAFEVMNRRGYNNKTKVNLNSQYTINWDLSDLLTKGLTVKGMISYDSYGSSTLEGNKTEINYVTNLDYDTNTISYALRNSNASELSVSRWSSSNYRINLQGSLNYNRSFGKHDVSAMVLAQRDYWETTAGEIPYNIVGVAGRATYAYDGRYLVEVNLGYNGSEQFAPTHRFGFFPAFSLGWNISNEKFLKDNDVLTNLKLRFSNGRVGNDNIGGNRFLYQDNITINNDTFASGLGGLYVSQGLLGNKDITWELADKTNYGIDFGIVKDFNISLDYYKEDRSQILITRQSVPIFQGVPIYTIPKANMGKVENHGYEAEVAYNKQVNDDLSIMVKGNFSFNDNKVTEYDEPIRTDDYACRYRSTGYRLGQPFGYVINKNTTGGGYWTSQEEIDNSGLVYSFGTPRPGDFVYTDQNGDGVIDDKDQMPIGYSSVVPGISYGLNLAANYKDFDFSIFFAGVGRYSMCYSAQGVYENTRQGTYFGYTRNAWTEERWLNGEEITYPALSTASTTNHVANDFFIQDRSFLRLKNIELGYTLPSNILKSLGVTKCRIYVGGQNLFEWDNLHTDHLDPEQNNSYGYSITKNMNIGCSLKF